MHPVIQKLADHFGVILSDRVCNSVWNEEKLDYERADHLFDGKTIAKHSRWGTLTDHDLMHEIAHFVCASPEQRDLPEYGLGYVVIHGQSYVPNVVDMDSHMQESNIQEMMTQFLCMKWGMAYGIPTAMAEESYSGFNYAKDWDHYFELKMQEKLAESKRIEWGWEALFRLEKMGMLHSLPF